MAFACMIVLDTHIWLWWINDDQQSLGLIRQEQIASAEVAAVSAIAVLTWLGLNGIGVSPYLAQRQSGLIRR